MNTTSTPLEEAGTPVKVNVRVLDEPLKSTLLSKEVVARNLLLSSLVTPSAKYISLPFFFHGENMKDQSLDKHDMATK